MENSQREIKQAEDVFGSEENAKSLTQIIKDTLNSYSNKPKELSLNEWVKYELKKYPDEFPSDKDIEENAKYIIQSIDQLNKNRSELRNELENGKTKESWIARKIEEGAKASNIHNIAEYGNSIKQTLKQANEQSMSTFINGDNSYNMNPNLHGFVAENHHVNSFNLEATVQNSLYRAKMLQSTGKNSVDIVIVDEAGKIVKKYGAKYGKSSSDTQKYFEKGDYRGQRKLVADGQQLEIENSTNVIEIDGLQSEPLNYEEARKIQKDIQEKKDIQEYKWDKVGKTKIAKQVVAETSKTVLMHSVIQGGRILGRRVWNSLTGKKNNETNEDVKEWLESSWLGAKAIGIQTAVTTGVTIAVKKGLIKGLAKATPVGRIAETVYIGIENVKVMYKMAKGEIGFKEGLKEMETVTNSVVGGIAGAGIGMAKGAAIGSALGPIGATVGGAVGAVMAGMAGSSATELITKGFQKVREKAVDTVVTVAKTVKSAVKSVSSAISSMASALNPLNWF